MWVIDGRSKPAILEHFKQSGVIIPSSTIDTIVRRHREEGGRIAVKPPRPRSAIYTTTERKRMADIADQHSDWTYDQVASEWQREHETEEKHVGKPSHGTLAKAFKEFNVTTKDLTPVPIARNLPANIEARYQYSQEAIGWDRESLVFINETGFDKHQHRRRGRSRKGTLATYAQPTSKGNRLNLCAAVSSEFGLIMHRTQLNTFGEAEFASFMQDLISHPLLQSRSCYFIMDGIAWHHSPPIHDVLAASRIHHEIKKMPPYSPHLNAIEYVFSKWKSEVKKHDQTTATLSLTQQVDQASTVITPRLVSRCLDHVYKYYAHCLTRQPLEDFDPRMDEGRHEEHSAVMEVEEKKE